MLGHREAAEGGSDVIDDQTADRYRAAEKAMWVHHGAPAPTELRVEVPELGIEVRVLEAGSGRPVLFVHGGPNAGATWGPLVAGVSGFRALAVDRPGCGLSDSIDYTGMDLDDVSRAMVDTLEATIDSLVGGPVDVVGSSFGGGCVLWLAHARPDLVRRIVLEGVPTIDGMRLAMNLRILAIGPLGRFIAGRRASVGDLRRSFKQIGHQRLVESGWPEGPDRDWGLSMMNDTATMKNEVAIIQRAATWRGFKPGLFDPADLGSVGAGTLWLVGDNDPFGTVDMVEQWASAMPSATVEVQRGAGHLPWLDDPAGHASRIMTFLESEDAAT